MALVLTKVYGTLLARTMMETYQVTLNVSTLSGQIVYLIKHRKNVHLTFLHCIFFNK